MPAFAATLADQLVVPVAVPLPPRLFDQETDATAPLSEAVPDIWMTECLVSQVDPAPDGATMPTAGLTLSGTANAIATLQGPAPVDVIVSTVHLADPGASATFGLNEQTVVVAQPAADAVTVVRIRPAVLLSSTTSR